MKNENTSHYKCNLHKGAEQKVLYVALVHPHLQEYYKELIRKICNYTIIIIINVNIIHYLASNQNHWKVKIK